MRLARRAQHATDLPQPLFQLAPGMTAGVTHGYQLAETIMRTGRVRTPAAKRDAGHKHTSHTTASTKDADRNEADGWLRLV